MKEEVDRLFKLKEIFETKDKEKSKVEGKIESVLQSLNDLGCKSVENAVKEEEKLTSSMTKLEDKFKKGLKELESKYDWGI